MHATDIQEVYFNKGGHFWVVIDDVNSHGEGDDVIVVGMVGLEHKSNDEAKLRRMSVNKEYRNRGVCTCE
jgi:N-acetylglutamate synthase-like GNAT family acetyltransferase